MRRTIARTCTALALGALASTANAKVPKAVAHLAALAPGDVKAISHLEMGPGFHDWAFGFMPLGGRYREVYTQRSRVFEERTGINPLRDFESMTMVFSEEDGAKHVVGFFGIQGDVKRLAKVLAEDPGVKEYLEFSSPFQAVSKDGKGMFRFVSGGVFFGEAETMKALRGKDERGESPLPAIVSEAGGPTPRFMVGAVMKPGPKPPPPPEGAPPNPMMALMGSSAFAMGWGGNHFEIRVDTASAEDAAAAKQFLQESLDKAMDGLEKAAAADPKTASLADVMNGQKISVEAWRLWAKDFLQPLSFSSEGKTMRIQRARGLPDMPISTLTLPLIGVAAAIAVPNFKGARDRANRRACYAYQKTYAGALEMYHLDHRDDVKVLDDAMRQKLVSEGYLMSIPVDPGQGPGSEGNYYFDEAVGNRVVCKMHGSIMGEVPGELPRDEGPSRSSGPAAVLPTVMKTLGGMMNASPHSEGKAGPFADPGSGR
jgi:competence protein ComGC